MEAELGASQARKQETRWLRQGAAVGQDFESSTMGKKPGRAGENAT